MRILFVSILMLAFAGNVYANEKKAGFGGFGLVAKYSALVVSFNGQPETDNALVLACGHCIDLNEGQLEMKLFREVGKSYDDVFVEPKEMFYDYYKGPNEQSSNRFNLFEMTLIRLKETYRELKQNYGIQPYLISSEKPIDGNPFRLRYSRFQDAEACTINHFSDLLRFTLGNREFLLANAIVYTDCISRPGDSGKLLISTDRRVVYGSNLGGTDPDEVNGDVLSFATSLHVLYGCLEKDFSLNFKKQGCKLPDDRKTRRPVN